MLTPAKKMQPKVAAGSERDYLGHIQPYLGTSVYDSSQYVSVDTEVNGDEIAYQGPYWDTQHCVEKYLTNLSSWFGKQGRAVHIVLGPSIRSNPSMINAEYTNMEVVFCLIPLTLLPLQLGATNFMHYTRLL